MARYLIGEQIGSGGFCTVRLCTREGDNLQFALKTLTSDDPESQERFKREVRLLSRLDHPRILKILETQLSSTPLSYLMPLYKHSLSYHIPEICGDEGRIRIVYDAVLEGMEFAHKNGVIHRDLNPNNILMNSDNDVVVSDFGLGRALDSNSPRFTTARHPLGTLGYIAPEQSTDPAMASAKSDVFALGRILYQMFTGEGPIAIPDYNRIPPGIARIAERCLKTNPDDRFRDAGELRAAFLQLYAIVDRNTIEGELHALLSTATSTGELSNDEISSLSAAINEFIEDVDTIHNVCMQLPQRVLVGLFRNNPHLFRRMISVFTEQIMSQHWDFSYVDSLASTCSIICMAIEDRQIRVTLITAIVRVSSSHNRYYAMDIAADLLYLSSNPGIDEQLARSLSSYPWATAGLRDRIKLGRLGPEVRALFNTEIPDDDEMPF